MVSSVTQELRCANTHKSIETESAKRTHAYIRIETAELEYPTEFIIFALSFV